MEGELFKFAVDNVVDEFHRLKQNHWRVFRVSVWIYNSRCRYDLSGKGTYQAQKNRFRQRQYLFWRCLYGSFKLKSGTSFLACQQISRQFSRLNRALCWNAFPSAWRQKSDENAKLNLDELKEVTWDVESVEEAVPVLTHT